MVSLYILKAICAILIVFIHLPGIWYEATILQPLMRVGVPIFFMISGFFLVSSSNIYIYRVENQLNKILRLTIWVYVVYIGFALIRNAVLAQPLIPERWLSLDFIFRMIFIGDNIDSVLWYLTAYIEALCILVLLLKTCKSNLTRKILNWATPILLFSAVLFNRYSDIFGRTFDIAVSRNALTVALPCIYIGSLVRIHQKELARMQWIGLYLCIFMVLSYVEYFLLHHYDVNGSGADFSIMTFPLSLSIFIFFVVNPDSPFIPSVIKNSLVSVGKNNSSDLYLWHSLTWLVISLLILSTGIKHIESFTNAESVIVIVLIISIFKNKIKTVRWNMTK